MAVSSFSAVQLAHFHGLSFFTSVGVVVAAVVAVVADGFNPNAPNENFGLLAVVSAGVLDDDAGRFDKHASHCVFESSLSVWQLIHFHCFDDASTGLTATDDDVDDDDDIAFEPKEPNENLGAVLVDDDDVVVADVAVGRFAIQSSQCVFESSFLPVQLAQTH